MIFSSENSNFIDLHENDIFDIWKNMFHTPNFEGFTPSTSTINKKKKKKNKRFENYIYAKFHISVR